MNNLNQDFYHSTMDTASICTKYHISPNILMSKVEKMYSNKLGRRDMFWNADEEVWQPKSNATEQIIKLHESGMPLKKIAVEMCLPYNFVHSQIVSSGREILNVQLNKDDVMEEAIYNAWKSTKLTTEQIAKQVGTTHKMVITVLNLHGVKFKDAKTLKLLDRNYMRK